MKEKKELEHMNPLVASNGLFSLTVSTGSNYATKMQWVLKSAGFV